MSTLIRSAVVLAALFGGASIASATGWDHGHHYGDGHGYRHGYHGYSHGHRYDDHGHRRHYRWVKVGGKWHKKYSARAFFDHQRRNGN